MIRNLMYRIPLLLITVSAAVTLSGCWNIKDINHRSLPVIMGLQHKNGVFQVWLLLPEASEGRSNVRVVSDAGKTIEGTIDRIGKNMETRVDLLHLKVIVFGQALAEKGLGDTVSGFMRARDIPAKTLAAICDGELEPLFDRLKSSTSNNGIEAYNYFEKNAGWTPQVAQTRIWQIYRSLHSYTRDVAIPIIKPGRTTTLESTGSAVIKNGRMVARITPDETLLYNLFNGQGAQGRIEVMDHAAVQILTDRMTHQSALKEGKAVLNSRLHLKVTVLETISSPTSDRIRQELNELLTTRFQRMFRELQREEADILGVGQFFRARMSREDLRDWRSDHYPHLLINFRVDSIIENVGLLNTMGP
ncbi:Ger(x)C family spore germination protein [Cohnella caldifontis]|uniref:Ger(x)C family spore germination protein n=1 Tax=Cohnella caldifontis TaxID=3027471 RepID=UPI0023ED31B1|nr:Ger(x)C family spore germination protein [Cohnella sp. YIM B05605]